MDKQVYEHISKQTQDPIVQRNICKRTRESFPIFQSEIDMLDKLSPIIGGKKYSLPIPDLSPKARQINRLMFRNERHFYKKKTIQGQTEISVISPESGLKTSNFKDYFEGGHDELKLEYSGDIKKDLQQLRKESIFPSKLIANMDNSDYCNQETDDKNCYLNAGGHFNEDCSYNTYSLYGKNNIDNYRVINSENTYRSYDIVKSNKIFFSSYIENSYNIFFSKDIEGSNNIILSYGIKNGQYIYKNKQYDKDAWNEIFQDYSEKMKTYSGLQQIISEYDRFMSDKIQKNLFNNNNEIAIGDEITNSKKSIFCLSLEEGENIMHANINAYIKDCMDTESVGRSNRVYQFCGGSKISNCIIGAHVLDYMSNGHYTAFSQNGDNLFSCLGVNHKKNCILNKEYPIQEYNKIVDDIIQDMKKQNIRGRFFMPELSPFPYNDTVVTEYYPIYKIISNNNEQIVNEKGIGIVTILEPEKFISSAILDLGGEEKIKIKRRTRETEVNIPDGLETIKSNDLSDSMSDIDDSILQKAIICDISKRPFRIVKPELDFHRKHNIALPRLHPDVRHQSKIEQRPSRELNITTCSYCGMQTLTSQNLGIKVSCEDCYNKKIYG